jgi:hypothetical protein
VNTTVNGARARVVIPFVFVATTMPLVFVLHFRSVIVESARKSALSAAISKAQQSRGCRAPRGMCVLCAALSCCIRVGATAAAAATAVA